MKPDLKPHILSMLRTIYSSKRLSLKPFLLAHSVFNLMCAVILTSTLVQMKELNFIVTYTPVLEVRAKVLFIPASKKYIWRKSRLQFARRILCPFCKHAQWQRQLSSKPGLRIMPLHFTKPCVLSITTRQYHSAGFPICWNALPDSTCAFWMHYPSLTAFCIPRICRGSQTVPSPRQPNKGTWFVRRVLRCVKGNTVTTVSAEIITSSVTSWP